MGKFSDFTVEGEHGIALDWEWIGEGNSGDYDEDDPDDSPRLRATVTFNGEQLEDGSYCTLATLDTPKEELITSAKDLLASVKAHPYHRGGYCLHPRSVMELWTWKEYSK